MDEAMVDTLVAFYESPSRPSERQKAFRINILKTFSFMGDTTIFASFLRTISGSEQGT